MYDNVMVDVFQAIYNSGKIRIVLIWIQYYKISHVESRGTSVFLMIIV